MTIPNAPFTESVQRKRLPGRDRHGDPTGSADSTGIDGCIVWPRASSETTAGQDTVIIGLQVLLPPATDILATDELVVRGAVYAVEGEPATYRSPFTGLDPGVLVSLKRVTG